MTSDMFAQWCRELGTTVLRHNGCDWRQTNRGFYEPLHWMAGLTPQQATSPAPLSWGFRAGLREDDAWAANGAIPIYWLPNLVQYDEGCLSSKRRKHLRQCRNRVRIVQLMEPDILREQGYDILTSSIMRTSYSRLPTRAEFSAGLVEDVIRGRRLVLAGLIDGKLGGYVTGYAVGGVAYLSDVVVATEALPSNIGIGLQFEFVQACRRSGEIGILVHGLHSREDRSLCYFKEDIGFRVRRVPARVRINPIVRFLMRRQYPHKYYRLTGIN